MDNVADESPTDQDLYGDVHVNVFGFPDSFVDIDAFSACHDAPPSETELDALFIAEMERRDCEAAEM